MGEEQPPVDALQVPRAENGWSHPPRGETEPGVGSLEIALQSPRREAWVHVF